FTSLYFRERMLMMRLRKYTGSSALLRPIHVVLRGEHHGIEWSDGAVPRCLSGGSLGGVDHILHQLFGEHRRGDGVGLVRLLHIRLLVLRHHLHLVDDRIVGLVEDLLERFGESRHGVSRRDSRFLETAVERAQHGHRGHHLGGGNEGDGVLHEVVRDLIPRLLCDEIREDECCGLGFIRSEISSDESGDFLVELGLLTACNHSAKSEKDKESHLNADCG
ncbi:hypothetical protein PENTCL1PPCAC_14431, partial [Pristionchus entomophagus]